MNTKKAGRKLSAWMARYAKLYPVHGDVLVASGDKVLYKRSFGYADIENKVKNTGRTRFRIGSVTKQFTAAAVLLLEQQGKLSVRDRLSKYFPSFPRGREISIHHLLSHSSGIHNYTDTARLVSLVASPTTQERVIAMFRNKKLAFKPGTKASYSNSGYTLLGRIIEIVSGMSYGDFISRNILIPLSLRNTGAEMTRDPVPSKARGYDYNSDRIINANTFHMSWPFSAGNMYSTAADLHRWNLALYGGRLFKSAGLKKMLSPHHSFGNVRACYGLMTQRFHGFRMYLHSGGIFGYVCLNIHIPSVKTSVIGLFNFADQDLGFLFRLAEIVLGRSPELPSLPKKTKIDAKQAAELTGLYKHCSLKGLSVRVEQLEDGHFRLTFRWPGSVEPPDRRLFYPVSPMTLRHIRIDSTLGFYRDKKTKKMKFFNFEKTG